MLETYSSSATVYDSQQYYAYGAKRGGGTLQTDQLFTGQKQDSTGLMYYRSRYYDPASGQFTSPDTLVPDATSVLSYNRFMYTRGNPLNRTDPTGHNDAIFDQYGGGGGKEALLIKAAIDLVAITIATQRATYGPPPLVAPRVPSWDEFWPQQQEEQPSVTGFPTITAEDDGLLSTPSSPAPGMDVLTEPAGQTQEVGSNVLELVYEQSPKHHQNVSGNVSQAPTNGQGALDSSIQIKPTSSRRIGFDSTNGEIVVFDETINGVFHGHVRTWDQLTQEMRNILIDNGTHSRKGKVK